MLVLSRKQDQKIQIGEEISVQIVRIRGNTIQIGITAPRDIHIIRSELLEREKATVLPFDAPSSSDRPPARVPGQSEGATSRQDKPHSVESIC